LVERDEKVDRRRRRHRSHRFEPFLHALPGGLDVEVRLEILPESALVGERKFLGLGLQEEIERIAYGHVGDEVDFDREPANLLRKDNACEEIAVRILLPVQEVAVGLDLQRVAQHRRMAVRRRAQPNDLRPHLRRAVVLVTSLVIQGDVQGHELPAECRGSW
jgi:hypothetical protein